MEINTRVVLELTSDEGLDPQVQVDTDLLDPPSFASLIGAPILNMVVAAAAVDVPAVIPAACIVLLVATEPIDLRLTTGETPMRVRCFLAAGADEEGAAMPARTWLLSGNGDNTSNVRIYIGETVT